MTANSEENIHKIIDENNRSIMSAFKDFFKSKFDKMKLAQELSMAEQFSKLKDAQEQGILEQQNQLQEIRASVQDVPRFRKKGNEEQFRHNSKVLQLLLDSQNSLGVDANDDSAKANIKEKLLKGITLMEHCQKLIKLADASEAGWALVAEYESNPLADDSDDERKINKAQLRAERKIKDLKKRGRKKENIEVTLRDFRWLQQPELVGAWLLCGRNGRPAKRGAVTDAEKKAIRRPSVQEKKKAG